MAFKSLGQMGSSAPMGPGMIITVSGPDKTEMLSKLFHARDVIHLAHLKTGSYAAHKALNEAYEYLLDFADDLVEMEQGKAGTTFDLTIPSSSYQEPISFLKELNDYLQQAKGMYCDATINKIEELQANINQTLYKLTILK
jgi:hypothetical protein